MKRFNWQDYEWTTKDEWEKIHPEKTWFYHGDDSYDIKDDVLHLYTKHNPKSFEELNVVSNIDSGFIRCTEKFEYGTFEIDAMLPTGKFLWPAFWLWPWENWPPEIDVFEGYSNSRGNYFKPRLKSPFGFWNVQTNVHIGDSYENHSFLRGKTHWLGFKNPAKYFNNYKVEWFPDKIEIYYNGRSVRRVVDKDVLNQFKDVTMRLIISTGVTKEYDINSTAISDFVVKSFNYKKY